MKRKIKELAKLVYSAALQVLSVAVKVLTVLVFSAVALQCTVPLVIVAFRFVPELTFTAIGLILIIYLILRLGLVLKRRKFLRQLSAFCRADHCTLTFFGHPMLNSLFRVPAGAKMEYTDHTTEVYFVPCARSGVKVLFLENGSAVYLHRIAVKDVTLLSWRRVWQFCDTPAKGSYVLLMPAPKKAYAVQIKPEYEVDNATVCGNYTIFTAGAFLRYMERISSRYGK